MKLKNKKTGEIVSLQGELTYDDKVRLLTYYGSLAELNEEWEDYEEPKEYWYIDWNGQVCRSDIHDEKTEQMKLIGNYFETEEKAEKAAERLRALTRLKDKGFKITLCGCKGNARLKANWGSLKGDYSDVLLLFGGEE